MLKIRRISVTHNDALIWRADIAKRIWLYLFIDTTYGVATPDAITILSGSEKFALKWEGGIYLSPIQKLERRLRYWLPRLARMANPLPVYWGVDSRDCDHVRGTSAHRSSTGWRYLKELDAVYDGAEGPTSTWRMSRKEYEQFRGSWRDYGAEAHEDGHRHYCDY